jgi:hypothetical protein
MQAIHLTLLAAILAAANARELLPSRTTILPPKEPKDRLLSSTSRAPLQRRQADYDTLVEVGSGTTVAQDLSSEYNIDVEIYNQDRGRSGEGCPDTIKIIAAAGANIPEIGTAFGTVSFMCDEVEWEGEATG